MSKKSEVSLYQRAKKIESYQKIQNLMGRAIIAYNFSKQEEFENYFALEQETVSIEVADEGLFEGKKAVKAMMDTLFLDRGIEGEMMDIHLTTPIIEVADDLKTAKATWLCPGAGSLVEKESNNDPQAIWVWGSLAVDFIFDDNEWKIWHLHYFQLIKCDYQKGWVDDLSMVNRLNTAYSEFAKQTTYHNPYTPLSIRDGKPNPPTSYTTWDEANRFWSLSTDQLLK